LFALQNATNQTTAHHTTVLRYRISELAQIQMELSKRSSDAAKAGAVAGLVSRMLVAPLDVIKVRWQTASSSHSGLSASLRSILAAQGVSGLFRGNA
jgi:hypothetical protein